MDLLGDSVDGRFVKCGRCVKDTTAMWLLKQMLACVEAMHAAFFLHRDIKPHNFAMSTRPPYVKLIDMGLASNTAPATSSTSSARPTGSSRNRAVHLSQRAPRHRALAAGRPGEPALRAHVPAAGQAALAGVDAECKEAKYARIGRSRCPRPRRSSATACAYDVYVLLKYVKGIMFASKPDYQYMQGVIQDYLDRENLGGAIPTEWFAA